MNAVSLRNEIVRAPGTSGAMPFIWDIDSGMLRENKQAGKNARLTPKQAEVFEVLLRAFPRVASKAHIMDSVYGLEGDEPSEKIVDIFICKIREKLIEANVPVWIETVWSRGYQLVMRPPPARPPRHHKRLIYGKLQHQADAIWAYCTARPGKFIPREEIVRIADIKRQPHSKTPLSLEAILAYLRQTGRQLMSARSGGERGYFVDASSQVKSA